MGVARTVLESPTTLTLSAAADETPTAVADVTVTVTRANGQTVTDMSLDGPSSGGAWALTLRGDAVSLLDTLAVTWAGTVDDVPLVVTDLVEVVGARLFSLTEARASDPSLADTTAYPTSEVDARRLEVELECEAICGRAFFPRHRRVRLDGSGSPRQVVPDVDLRSVRSVDVRDTAGATQAWDAGSLSAVAVSTGELLVRVDGVVWPRGAGNLTIGYEHGLTTPPEDLRQAALIRLRSVLKRNRSGVPDRVASYTNEAGTFRIAMPGARRTGIPDVDAAYDRWATPTLGFA